MARSAEKHPTELELQILKILWADSPLLAREVQDRLAGEGRELAKTSVITTLNNMVTKRYLKRKKHRNSFLFSPNVSEQTVSEEMLGDVVDRVFDGSTSAVLMKLFDVGSVSDDELKELRRLINRKLKEK